MKLHGSAWGFLLTVGSDSDQDLTWLKSRILCRAQRVDLRVIGMWRGKLVPTCGFVRRIGLPVRVRTVHTASGATRGRSCTRRGEERATSSTLDRRATVPNWKSCGRWPGSVRPPARRPAAGLVSSTASTRRARMPFVDQECECHEAPLIGVGGSIYGLRGGFYLQARIQI